jgi:hypothetical protein
MRLEVVSCLLVPVELIQQWLKSDKFRSHQVKKQRRSRSTSQKPPSKLIGAKIQNFRNRRPQRSTKLIPHNTNSTSTNMSSRRAQRLQQLQDFAGVSHIHSMIEGLKGLLGDITLGTCGKRFRVSEIDQVLLIKTSLLLALLSLRLLNFDAPVPEQQVSEQGVQPAPRTPLSASTANLARADSGLSRKPPSAVKLSALDAEFSLMDAARTPTRQSSVPSTTATSNTEEHIISSVKRRGSDDECVLGFHSAKRRRNVVSEIITTPRTLSQLLNDPSTFQSPQASSIQMRGKTATRLPLAQPNEEQPPSSDATLMRAGPPKPPRHVPRSSLSTPAAPRLSTVIDNPQAPTTCALNPIGDNSDTAQQESYAAALTPVKEMAINQSAYTLGGSTVLTELFHERSTSLYTATPSPKSKTKSIFKKSLTSFKRLLGMSHKASRDMSASIGHPNFTTTSSTNPWADILASPTHYATRSATAAVTVGSTSGSTPTIAFAPPTTAALAPALTTATAPIPSTAPVSAHIPTLSIVSNPTAVPVVDPTPAPAPAPAPISTTASTLVLERPAFANSQEQTATGPADRSVVVPLVYAALKTESHLTSLQRVSSCSLLAFIRTHFLFSSRFPTKLLLLR